MCTIDALHLINCSIIVTLVFFCARVFRARCCCVCSWAREQIVLEPENVDKKLTAENLQIHYIQNKNMHNTRRNQLPFSFFFHVFCVKRFYIQAVWVLREPFSFFFEAVWKLFAYTDHTAKVWTKLLHNRYIYMYVNCICIRIRAHNNRRINYISKISPSEATTYAVFTLRSYANICVCVH